ncbi:MAG: hypothetical protein ACFFB5_10515 [Promethearchaeota archaeon]
MIGIKKNKKIEKVNAKEKSKFFHKNKQNITHPLYGKMSTGLFSYP